MLGSFQPDGAHPLLLPLFDAVDHRQRGRSRPRRRIPVAGWDGCGARNGLSGHRGAGLRDNLRIRESVVLVESLQSANVGGHQRLAVCAMAVQCVGGMHTQHLLQRRGVEVTVALDRYPFDAPPRAQAHPIQNHHLLRGGGLLLMIHFHVEVTLPLIVVPQPPVALVQQVFVHGAFLIDRNDLFGAFRVHAGALYEDFHLRSAAGGKFEVGPLGLCRVPLRLKLDFGLQPLLATVLFEHPGQGVVIGVVVHARTGSQVRVSAELLGAHAGVARHVDRSHPRLRTADHVKRDIHQLFIGMRRQNLGDRRFVKAVLRQCSAHLFQRLVQLGRGIAGAGCKLAGALQLRIHGGPLGSVHAYRPNEGARRAAKDQGHSILLALCLHLDVLVKSGGK